MSGEGSSEPPPPPSTDPRLSIDSPPPPPPSSAPPPMRGGADADAPPPPATVGAHLRGPSDLPRGKKDEGKAVDPETYDFAAHLSHQFPLVNSQVEAGLYVLKRAAALLKKICAFQETYSTNVLQAVKHERAKSMEDAMFRHVNTTTRMVDMIGKTGENVQKFCQAVLTQVVVPLDEHYKVADAKRKSVVADEQRLRKCMEQTRQDVVREREACLKNWEQLQLCEKQLAEERLKDPKKAKVDAAEKKLKKQQEKTHKSFLKLETMRKEALESLRYYHENELPGFLKQMQDLETERMDVLKKLLLVYNDLHQQSVAPLAIWNVFEHGAQTLDTQVALQSCVQTWRSAYGEPPEPAPLLCGLPCPADAVLSDAWMAVAPDWESKRVQTVPIVMPSGRAKSIAGSNKHRRVATFSSQTTDFDSTTLLESRRSRADTEDESFSKPPVDAGPRGSGPPLKPAPPIPLSATVLSAAASAKPAAAPAVPSSPHPWFKAVLNHTPGSPQELKFSRGDILFVTSRNARPPLNVSGKHGNTPWWSGYVCVYRTKDFDRIRAAAAAAAASTSREGESSNSTNSTNTTTGGDGGFMAVARAGSLAAGTLLGNIPSATGVFPVSAVEPVTDAVQLSLLQAERDRKVPKRRGSDPGAPMRVKAVRAFEYKESEDDAGEDDDDDEEEDEPEPLNLKSECLTFRVGDMIQVLRADEQSNWWLGQINGVTGFFPRTHVTVQYTTRGGRAAAAAAAATAAAASGGAGGLPGSQSNSALPATRGYGVSLAPHMLRNVGMGSGGGGGSVMLDGKLHDHVGVSPLAVVEEEDEKMAGDHRPSTSVTDTEQMDAPPRRPLPTPTGAAPGSLRPRSNSADHDHTGPDAQPTSEPAIPRVADKHSTTLVDLVRSKVSKKKKRFQQDGFDLDLSYITDNIVAMGFPSEGIDAMYRNNMRDVQRFFNTRHPGLYWVYNLCAEREYDPQKFNGNVSHYPFEDHNPCPFDTIAPFCADVHMWLTQNPQHVAAIHCKAGKGRTGFLIACYLIHSGMCKDAASALNKFAVMRTSNAKGVTIPSQMRYVHYYEHAYRGLPLPKSNPLYITGVAMITVPKAVRSQYADIFFTISCGNMEYSSKGKVPPTRLEKDSSPYGLPAVVFTPRHTTSIPVLENDVRMTFYNSSTFGKTKLFQFWFNTLFVKPVEGKEVEESVVRDSSLRGAGAADDDGDDEAGNGGDDGDRGREESVPPPPPPPAGGGNKSNEAGGPDKKQLQRVYSLVLPKSQLDKACKDTKHKDFDKEFRIEIMFRGQ